MGWLSPPVQPRSSDSRPRSIDVESITQPLDDLLELDLRVLDLALNGDLARRAHQFL